MSSPSITICPASGLSNPSMRLIIVDLPLPEPPRAILVSPRRTVKLTLSRTTWSSKARSTSRNSIAGIMSLTGCREFPAACRFLNWSKSCCSISLVVITGSLGLYIRVLPRRVIISFERKKSAIIMQIDERTTAFVVDIPTPTVPPFVFSPL